MRPEGARLWGEASAAFSLHALRWRRLLHSALSENLLFLGLFSPHLPCFTFPVSQLTQGEMGAERHFPLSREHMNFIMKLPEAEMLPEVKE